MTGASHVKAARVENLFRWLNQPDRVYARWLNKTTVCVAWLGLILAALHPPHATRVSVCWFKVCTGLSCPGCGLTRSLSCGIRGMFAESWLYHPMGLLLLALFVAVVSVSLLPRSARQRLARCMESRAVWFNTLYLLFVVTFLAVGLCRTAIQFARV